MRNWLTSTQVSTENGREETFSTNLGLWGLSKARGKLITFEDDNFRINGYLIFVWMWELDCKESWGPKNWRFWNVVLEKTLENPLDCKESQPVHPKRDQSWVFIRRTDAEAETPILWPPHAKSWLIGKDPDAERDWGQEEKGTTEDEMAGWHDRLDGHESEWTPGVGDEQGGLACWDSWGAAIQSWTRLNWTELNIWWQYLPHAHVTPDLTQYLVEILKDKLDSFYLSFVAERLEFQAGGSTVPSHLVSKW